MANENSQVEQEVVHSLAKVRSNISQITNKLSLKNEPRLVAVSKTKPISLIKACYDAGQRHFGENYVQELIDKSKQLPEDICWHFIGHLQSNKCKILAQVPNLWVIETVDSVSLANTLNKQLEKAGRKQNIFVQVNTSGEETKSGITPKDCVAVVKSIITNNLFLQFCGLMTIGDPNASQDQPDFYCLKSCKDDLCAQLSIKPEDVELSMGMSHDYQQAIQMGSTNVRVGSVIFGERNYSNNM